MVPKSVVFVLAFMVVLAAAFLWFSRPPVSLPSAEPVSIPKLAIFNCDDGKSISATFHIGDDRFVDLVLSDGRTLSVPRAISASGARYATADESFVFWNKGDTAFVTENGTTTFDGCLTNS